jgi:hypothetical protein
MALARVTTWSSGEVLTAAALNAEYDNILSNALSLISPITGTLDLNGNELVLDVDADTSLTSDTDDQIDWRIGGTDVIVWSLTAMVFNEQGADINFRVESDTNANALFLDAGLFTGVGAIGLAAAATDAAVVLIDNPALTATAATNIAKLRIENTAAITVPAGVTALAASLSIDEPNLTATGTITVAATVYIEAAPSEGSSNYALWIDAGNTRLDGDLDIRGGDLTTDQTTFNLLDTTATTINFAGAATTLGIGADTGTTTFAGSTIPQRSSSIDTTTVAADANGHLLHPTADNNPRTFTIDSDANVPYPVGTAITFVNEINTLTIAITSDTLVLAGPGTTGSRTLAAMGMATALKKTTTSWIISGTGLT